MAYEPRDGDRVQERSTGIKGFVRRCTRKAPRPGHYYKVCLVTGEWVWPDRVIAESEGPYVTTCVDCGIAMKTQAPNGQGMCVNCAARENASAGPDARTPGYYQKQVREGIHRQIEHAKAPAPVPDRDTDFPF